MIALQSDDRSAGMDILSKEFFNTAKAACAKARQESLDIGLPVLYHDFVTSM